MRKTLLVISIFFSLCINASENIYEQNCVSCHKKLDMGIDKFFYNYLMVFSSEMAVKISMKDYLMHPMKEKSLLSEENIEKYGIKDVTTLKEEELEEAIDIYWKKYKVFDKLK